MKWFSVIITAYFWVYAVIFLFIGMEGNTNALIMSAFMVVFSLIITQITINNFKNKTTKK